jgi:hypothetical protein
VKSTALALLLVCAGAPSAVGLSGDVFSGVSVASPFPDVNDRISRVLPLSEGTPIRVDATIADVVITGSSRPDLQVQIVRRAPTAADLSRFAPIVETTPDGVRIAVVQADERKDANLKAEIAIASPATAVFQAIRVFEGRVRLTNLKASCDVDLRRGPIDASGLAGRIRLESGLGGVDVRDTDLTPGGMLRLRVFNGPLRVRFARAPANARILAVTFNGRIESDIPLTRKDRFGPRFGEATLGSGDPVLSMDVVKGDITIAVNR